MHIVVDVALHKTVILSVRFIEQKRVANNMIIIPLNK